MYDRVGDSRAASPPGLAEAPLAASRSLGRLLGLEALAFKVECWQPTGSWLDRSAAALAADAVDAGLTGLCTVGVVSWTLPLAMRCARAGLRCVVLEPTVSAASVQPEERGWLSALGVRTVAVEADARALREAAPFAAERAGLRLVSPVDPLLQAGLSTVLEEVEHAGHGERLLVVPGLTGGEPGWLAAAARHQIAAVSLPLDGLPTAVAGRPFAIVGRLDSPDVGGPDQDRTGAADRDESMVLAVTVSSREADAARRLLAREEGLVVSQRGGAGLAGLLGVLREDRARRPRERRLRGVASAVVVVTGEPLRAGDPPPSEPDAVPSRPVSLASLTTDLAQLLVEPPGR